jgi:hypothetical protein
MGDDKAERVPAVEVKNALLAFVDKLAPQAGFVGVEEFDFLVIDKNIGMFRRFSCDDEAVVSSPFEHAPKGPPMLEWV